MFRGRRAALLGAAVAGAVLLTAPTASATTAASAAEPAPAAVTVVHGLRGVVADVLLDGQPVLRGFVAERVTDPLSVPAGPHELAVRPASDPSGPPIVSASVDLAPGERRSVVVHPGADGQPLLSSFSDEDAAFPAGQGRLVLRNTAEVAPVQMQVDGEPVGGPVVNAAGVDTVLATGAHSVAALGANGEPLLDPVDVDVPAASTTTLYLIGSADEDSLGWLVQTTPAQAAPPTGVPAGSSGLKAATSSGTLSASSGSVAAVGLAVGGLGLLWLASAARRPERSC